MRLSRMSSILKVLMLPNQLVTMYSYLMRWRWCRACCGTRETMQDVIGLAMSPEVMSSLHDVYTSLGSEQPQQATYILQFLWRDLTSKFDAMGPYYSSAESLKSKFVLTCLYETMKIFQLYHFKTSAVVCDGASANLTALKATTGCIGAYGACTITEKNHGIPSPSFENPFSPPDMVYWIICPSHQVHTKKWRNLDIFHYNITPQLKKHDKRTLLFKMCWHKGLCIWRSQVWMGWYWGMFDIQYIICWH